MIAQPPLASPIPEPSLRSVAELMEAAARDAGDPFTFEVSQLLSAVGYALADGDPVPLSSLGSACHRIANVWLLR